MKDGGGGPKPPTPLKDWFSMFCLVAAAATCYQVAQEENVDPVELWKAAQPDIAHILHRIIKQFPEC